MPKCSQNNKQTVKIVKKSSIPSWVHSCWIDIPPALRIADDTAPVHSYNTCITPATAELIERTYTVCGQRQHYGEISTSHF